ncbi:MAG: hypothetical protein WCX95_01915 [Candidatus Gracilibacteria bacterium]
MAEGVPLRPRRSGLGNLMKGSLLVAGLAALSACGEDSKTEGTKAAMAGECADEAVNLHIETVRGGARISCLDSSGASASPKCDSTGEGEGEGEEDCAKKAGVVLDFQVCPTDDSGAGGDECTVTADGPAVISIAGEKDEKTLNATATDGEYTVDQVCLGDQGEVEGILKPGERCGNGESSPAIDSVKVRVVNSLKNLALRFGLIDPVDQGKV